MGRKRYLLVYKATNIIDGKSYVGQTTTNLANRKSSHKTKALRLNKPSPFYRAIRECGWENFTWEVVGYCESLEELDKLEADTIEELGGKAYNSSTGGRRNYNISDAHKEIVRKNMTGKRNPMYGKKLSDEDKKNLLAASMKVCSKQVQNIQTGKRYESMSECSRREGCSVGTVSLHCNNKVKNPRYKFL